MYKFIWSSEATFKRITFESTLLSHLVLTSAPMLPTLATLTTLTTGQRAEEELGTVDFRLDRKLAEDSGFWILRLERSRKNFGENLPTSFPTRSFLEKRGSKHRWISKPVFPEQTESSMVFPDPTLRCKLFRKATGCSWVSTRVSWQLEDWSYGRTAWSERWSCCCCCCCCCYCCCCCWCCSTGMCLQDWRCCCCCCWTGGRGRRGARRTCPSPLISARKGHNWRTWNEPEMWNFWSTLFITSTHGKKNFFGNIAFKY